MDLVRRCGRRTRKCCAISRPSCSGWPTATPKTSARSSTCPCSSRPWPRLSAPSPASRCLFPSSFPLSTVLRLCVCCCPSGGMTEHQCWLALWRETEYCCCSNHIITMLVLWRETDEYCCRSALSSLSLSLPLLLALALSLARARALSLSLMGYCVWERDGILLR